MLWPFSELFDTICYLSLSNSSERHVLVCFGISSDGNEYSFEFFPSVYKNIMVSILLWMDCTGSEVNFSFVRSLETWWTCLLKTVNISAAMQYNCSFTLNYILLSVSQSLHCQTPSIWKLFILFSPYFSSWQPHSYYLKIWSREVLFQWSG